MRSFITRVWYVLGSATHNMPMDDAAIAAANAWLGKGEERFVDWCEKHHVEWPGEFPSRVDILASTPGAAELGEAFLAAVATAGEYCVANGETITEELMIAAIGHASGISGTILCDPRP